MHIKITGGLVRQRNRCYSGDLSRFILTPQASGAQVETFLFTIDGEGSGVNVGYPAPVGVALRVADIMAELGRFSA